MVQSPFQGLLQAQPITIAQKSQTAVVQRLQRQRFTLQHFQEADLLAVQLVVIQEVRPVAALVDQPVVLQAVQLVAAHSVS
jgi:hypothetical protein